MYMSIAIALLGLFLLVMGTSIVRHETNDKTKQHGQVVFISGLVLIILAIASYPFINIWEASMKAKAEKVYIEELKDVHTL